MMSTEEKRLYDKNRYLEIKEKRKSQVKKYYAEHRSSIIQRIQKYDITHPEIMKRKQKNYSEKHRDKLMLKDLKRRTVNPDKWKEYQRKNHLKIFYGMTDEDYKTMLSAQGGVCAICRGMNNGKALEVDHSHKTGRIRGLLCRSCNTAIGFMKDDPKIANEVSLYLKERG